MQIKLNPMIWSRDLPFLLLNHRDWLSKAQVVASFSLRFLSLSGKTDSAFSQLPCSVFLLLDQGAEKLLNPKADEELRPDPGLLFPH